MNTSSIDTGVIFFLDFLDLFVLALPAVEIPSRSGLLDMLITTLFLDFVSFFRESRKKTEIPRIGKSDRLWKGILKTFLRRQLEREIRGGMEE